MAATRLRTARFVSESVGNPELREVIHGVLLVHGVHGPARCLWLPVSSVWDRLSGCCDFQKLKRVTAVNYLYWLVRIRSIGQEKAGKSWLI